MKLLQLCFVLSIVFSCKNKNQIIKHTKTQKNATIRYFEFDTTAILKHVETLSSNDFEGRKTGTKGAIKAKNYIVEAFKMQNVLPLGNSYEQAFSFKKEDQNYQATNVLGLIKGTNKGNEYIVLSAHYDHLGIKDGNIYNGADDDASGIGALIAFAEYFKKNSPKYNILLAAFDAEELGLKGANYFVSNAIIEQRKIKLNINLDMISRSNKNELFAVGTRYNPELKPAIAQTHFGKVKLIFGHEGLDDSDNWTLSSDHAAFYKANIPFVYFGVADHDDYHKPTDDFENIDQSFYLDAIQSIIHVFKQYDNLQL